MPGVRSRVVVVAALALVASGCAKHEGVLAPTIKDPVVYGDTFGSGVDFMSFNPDEGAKTDAVSEDTTRANVYEGTRSLKITVPGPGDGSGSWAGGTFATRRKRDLSVYNALTFWAKADHPITLNEVGLGIDASWNSAYQASTLNLPVGTAWAKYVVPIPNPDRLRDEGGLFYFSEGPENGSGCTIWLDDVMFEYVTSVTDARARIDDAALTPFVGLPFTVPGTRVTFALDGTDRTVDCTQRYFTFLSDNEAVAAGGEGEVRIVGVGHATITARLGARSATGTLTLDTKAAPLAAPPRPTLPASSVISLLSMAYTNVTVDRWSTDWDFGDVTDVTIDGDRMKLYTIQSYVAAECTSHPIDASAMTAFHLDVWVPAGGSLFKVKLVDFGADGQYLGGDDSEYELSFTSSSTPALQAGQWTQLELPLSAFTGLTNRAHIAQLFLSGDVGTAFLDNIYFHK
jgi:hypothetical protein